MGVVSVGPSIGGISIGSAIGVCVCRVSYREQFL